MTTLSELDGSRWAGDAELWLDPMGDVAKRSECTLAIQGNIVRYTWSYEGESQHGSITLQNASAPATGGAQFTDTWHQPDAMPCQPVPGARGLFQVEGAYGAEAEWGWRIGLSLRQPSDELVLQMTNIAPWGEEGRAVRMTDRRL